MSALSDRASGTPAGAGSTVGHLLESSTATSAARQRKKTRLDPASLPSCSVPVVVPPSSCLAVPRPVDAVLSVAGARRETAVSRYRSRRPRLKLERSSDPSGTYYRSLLLSAVLLSVPSRTASSVRDVEADCLDAEPSVRPPFSCLPGLNHCRPLVCPARLAIPPRALADEERRRTGRDGRLRERGRVAVGQAAAKRRGEWLPRNAVPDQLVSWSRAQAPNLQGTRSRFQVPRLSRLSLYPSLRAPRFRGLRSRLASLLCRFRSSPSSGCSRIAAVLVIHHFCWLSALRPRPG